MAGVEASMTENSGTAEKDRATESLVRGESAFVNEASVDVAESSVGAAKIVVRGSDSLARVVVDLTTEDAERIRDELTGELGRE